MPDSPGVVAKCGMNYPSFFPPLSVLSFHLASLSLPPVPVFLPYPFLYPFPLSLFARSFPCLPSFLLQLPRVVQCPCFLLSLFQSLSSLSPFLTFLSPLFLSFTPFPSSFLLSPELKYGPFPSPYPLSFLPSFSTLPILFSLRSFFPVTFNLFSTIFSVSDLICIIMASYARGT